MKKIIDLTNQTFGRLKVIKLHGQLKNGGALWLCQCTCSKTKVIRAESLRNGDTQSCGCLNKERVRQGNENKIFKNFEKRFWSKVKITNPSECWEWQGGTNSTGYGCFSIGP